MSPFFFCEVHYELYSNNIDHFTDICLQIMSVTAGHGNARNKLHAFTILNHV